MPIAEDTITLWSVADEGARMRRIVLSRLALVGAIAVLFGFLVPMTSTGATTAHPTYPLGSASSCKAHYVKKILTHKVKGKTESYIACVYKAPAGPTLTQQQRSAVEEANQYLSTEAFSQQGLIDQLDSPDGGGYSVHDATVAVDSLTVNWNAEAVKSAKEYLALEPFSCNDLIQQLDSPDGGEFTVAQATYGAQQAGDC
jgi:hypothetical protein